MVKTRSAAKGNGKRQGSCPLCNQPDNEPMVQCDKCDTWFHFKCVNVNEDVSENDWVCDKCNKKSTNAMDKEADSLSTKGSSKPAGKHAQDDDREDEFQSTGSSIPAGKHAQDEAGGKLSKKTIKSIHASKSGSSKSRRDMNLELMRLEEERKANLSYINKKYEIMGRFGSSDESEQEEDIEIAEQRMQRTIQWASGKGKSEVGRDHASGLGSFHGNEVVDENDGGACIVHNSDHNDDFKRQSNASRLLNHMEPGLGAASFLSAGQLSARQVVPRELPTFNGRPEEWPLFVSNFENSTRLCGFSHDENLLRLQRALKGKALEYVSSKLMIPAMVPEIISTLRMIFGRPEHVINNLLVKLRSTQNVNYNKLDTLINFALEVKNLTATLEAANLPSHLNNPMLIQELIEKLPSQLRLDWAIFSRNIKNTNLTVFSNWLFGLAEAASNVVLVPVSHMSHENEKRKAHRVGFHQEKEDAETVAVESSGPICIFCKHAHTITKCEKFKKQGYNDKWNVMHKLRLCRSCLKVHDPKFCRERKQCGVDKCTAKHHHLLHKPEITSNQSSAPTLVATQYEETSGVLYRIVPITIHAGDNTVDVYAFLDDGSGPTLIERGVLKHLKIQGGKSDLCLKWTDGTVRVESNSDTVDLKISPKGKSQTKFTLRNVRAVEALDLPSQTMLMPELTQKYEHLKGVPVESYRNVVPRVIIGLNNKSVAMPLKFREGKSDEPAATKTRLGWTVYGVLDRGLKDDYTKNGEQLQMHICECDDLSLQKLVIEHMNKENEYVSITNQDMISRARDEILHKSVARNGDHFVVKLLWKSETVTMPDNLLMAMQRLRCFERKLNRDENLKTQVSNHIQDMKVKGYIRKLTRSEIDADLPRKWYLPIFVVRNANKPQKIRLVWDAAAEYNGVSLNRCLEKGPDLLTSLIKVLFNFRAGTIGICGDICEMFHRVFVHKEDQHSQRFLWRDCDDSQIPDVYVLQVMSFGASCSPSLAQFVKNENASELSALYPRAAKSILERHYVDDMLDSVDSIEEAIQLGKDVREVHMHANFHIRNWLSNSKEVTEALGEPGSNNIFCRAGKSVEQTVEAEKVLGMWWQTTCDMFTFTLKFTKANEEVLRGVRLPTKRELLRMLMSIFDPLGILTFYLIFMKILFQKIWRSGITWDDEIPAEFADSWNKWLSFLPNIKDVQVPRCYFRQSAYQFRQIQVRVFVDASEYAYAAVAYFRIQYEESVDVALICSKSKIAPLRPTSIPRMELQAAVLGARLGNSIIKMHDFPIEQIHYWSDSKTVLLWLRSDPRSYKQFVMFRVGEIQETTEITQWKYVSTNLNVADLGTKWKNKPNFGSTSVWFTGPSFLRQPEESWPICQLKVEDKNDVERKPCHGAQIIAAQFCTPAPLINISRFSKWERLLKCMAYVKKFINILKRLTAADKTKIPRCQVNLSTAPNRIKIFRIIANLSTEELQWSETYLFRLAQAQAFESEIRMLQQNPTCALPKSSSLRKLSPFIDFDNIVRMRGRLEKATEIENYTKNPIILPKKQPITQLLVEWYHRKLKHINHETAINEIFQRFHISGLRNLLRTIRNNCPLCKIRNTCPQPPEMGPLPKARLATNTRPFSYVGIDFFGPVLVSVGRRTEKRYGVVFTCMTCRAVHIEMAYSLTMNSCVIVIRNFMSRRGIPIQIYSDNGTNLKAAEKELRLALLQVDFGALEAEFTTTKTKWVFIPPASPHMGGAWERMVRSIKSVMYQIITPETKLTDEKLNNTFLEVESIINSRPLTYLSLDTAEQEALTPNHLLLGSSSGSKPPGKFDASDQFVKSSCRHSQYLADKFWKRWVAEMLPMLTRRTNWFEKAKPIENGDVVIVVDPNLPRHCWPKGIVVNTVTGADGQVRSASVRTAHGEYHRPATKIAVLDIQNNRIGV